MCGLVWGRMYICAVESVHQDHFFFKWPLLIWSDRQNSLWPERDTVKFTNLLCIVRLVTHCRFPVRDWTSPSTTKSWPPICFPFVTIKSSHPSNSDYLIWSDRSIWLLFLLCPVHMVRDHINRPTLPFSIPFARRSLACWDSLVYPDLRQDYVFLTPAAQNPSHPLGRSLYHQSLTG